MFRTISALVLGLALSSPVFAADKAYYEIKKVTVTNVTAKYHDFMDLYSQPVLSETCGSGSQNFRTVFSDTAAAPTPSAPAPTAPAPKPTTPAAPVPSPRSGTDLNPIDQVEVIVDQIINIGKKIWNIVEAGKPVVNVKFDTANALPRGVTCWADMSGWSIPQTQLYTVNYENGWGMTVVSFTYRLTFTGKGNVNGIGQYITNATFMPANIKVAWGFQFDATADIPSVFNQGTKENPLAGMQMNMNWRVRSAVTDIQQSETYFVSGDNSFKHLQ